MGQTDSLGIPIYLFFMPTKNARISAVVPRIYEAAIFELVRRGLYRNRSDFAYQTMRDVLENDFSDIVKQMKEEALK